MKFVYSIRFRLLISILIFILLFMPVLWIVAIHFGKKELRSTYKTSKREIMKNTKRWTAITARLIFGSLRESMAKYDVSAMEKIVQMARAQKDIEAVRVFGPKMFPGPNNSLVGQLRFNGDTKKRPPQVYNIECSACHTSTGALRIKVKTQKAAMVDAQARIDVRTSALNIKHHGVFEMIVHVFNQADPCYQCHLPTQKVNGVIQVDISEKNVRKLLRSMKKKEKETEKKFEQQIVLWTLLFMFISSAILLVIATGIVNKLAKLKSVAERVSLGETNVTMEDIPPSSDEVGELRDSFERMLVAVKFFMTPEEEPEEPV